MDRQILESIDVEVPAADAYAQWTQFEEFPRFMENVEKVRQLDDRRMRWSANFLGKDQEWNAEITEQIPEKRIAWQSTTGSPHAGVVTFHRLDDLRSRVTVQIDYSPEGVIENLGDFLGVVTHAVKRDLGNFKHFIENRAQPTGEWGGRILAPGERRSEPTNPSPAPAALPPRGDAKLPPATAGEAGKI